MKGIEKGCKKEIKENSTLEIVINAERKFRQLMLQKDQK